MEIGSALPLVGLPNHSRPIPLFVFHPKPASGSRSEPLSFGSSPAVACSKVFLPTLTACRATGLLWFSFLVLAKVRELPAAARARTALGSRVLQLARDGFVLFVCFSSRFRSGPSIHMKV